MTVEAGRHLAIVLYAASWTCNLAFCYVLDVAV